MTTLGWSLTALLREWSAQVEAVSSELPQGVRGYRVLAAIVNDEPPTQAVLAARLGIDRTVMTYLLDKFVECGLVERRQDLPDRRARRIVPTEKGKRVLADLDARVTRAEGALLSGLTAKDQRVLLGLLERAATAVAPGTEIC